MATKTNSAATQTELVLTRVFDAPRHLVFDAWTRPEHLEHWQGAPRGFTVPTHQVDIRPGGAYRICMRSPEGIDHWLQGIYREVVEPERLVFTHVWLDAEGNPGPETLVTITFAERGGKTELTLRQTGFTSVAARDGHQQGWTSTFDRLAEYLAQEDRPATKEKAMSAKDSPAAPSDRELVFTRVFEAPRELVFQAWTDPQHVVQWWGPNGFTTTIREMDVRPGGVWRFVMHGPDGVDYPNKIVYLEVANPERLVYAHTGEGEPVRFQVTVTFEDQEGKTKVTMRMVFDSAAELNRVEKKYAAIEGANQTLGRLAAHLTTMVS